MRALPIQTERTVRTRVEVFDTNIRAAPGGKGCVARVGLERVGGPVIDDELVVDPHAHAAGAHRYEAVFLGVLRLDATHPAGAEVVADAAGGAGAPVEHHARIGLPELQHGQVRVVEVGGGQS